METEEQKEKREQDERLKKEKKSQLKITALSFASGLMGGGTNVDTLLNNAAVIYNFIQE